MKKFIRRIFCRHKHKKHVFRELHYGGKIHRKFGEECENCAKTWWL